MKIPKLFKKRKVRVMIYSAILTLVLLTHLITVLAIVPEINEIEQYPMIKGAHRGDSVLYVENTLDAIEKAIEKPEYEFLEFDIQYTKDKKIIVFHDVGLFRMTGRSDQIGNLTYNELQNLTDFEIPQYHEAMDIIGNSKKISIEIKSQGNFEEDKELIDFVVKDCTERGVLDKIMIISVSADVIKYSKEKYPFIKTGKVYWIHKSALIPLNISTKDLYQDIDEMNADYIMLHGSNIHNMDRLVKNKPEGVTLVFWYFNNEMFIVQKDKTDVMW